MNFSGFIQTLKKQSFDFHGRMSRINFWHFNLWYTLLFVIFYIVVLDLFEGKMGIIPYVILLILTVPVIAASVRRLHDINMGWGKILLGLIPLVGQLLIYRLYVRKGDETVNQYGEPDVCETENTSTLNYFFDAVTSKYSKGNIRARRSEYWYYQLYQLISLLVSSTLPCGFITLWWVFVFPTIGIIGIAQLLVMLFAFIVPSFAVTFRRLHDVGKDWTYIFINLVPIVGSILLLVAYITEGERKANQWGGNPKEVAQSES